MEDWSRINPTKVGHFHLSSIFLAKSLQKNCFYVHEKLQRKPFVGRGLKFFFFQPYGFDKCPQGCYEVKKSRQGLLQGSRLTVRTTKNSIWRNH